LATATDGYFGEASLLQRQQAYPANRKNIVDPFSKKGNPLSTQKQNEQKRPTNTVSLGSLIKFGHPTRKNTRQ